MMKTIIVFSMFYCLMISAGASAQLTIGSSLTEERCKALREINEDQRRNGKRCVAQWWEICGLPGISETSGCRGLYNACFAVARNYQNLKEQIEEECKDK